VYEANYPNILITFDRSSQESMSFLEQCLRGIRARTIFICWALSKVLSVSILISTVGRAMYGYHGRITATHQYTCTFKWTTFCQGMQLKKYGHFGTGTSFQNPCSYKKKLVPGILALSRIIFEVKRTLSNRKWAINQGGKNRS